MKSNIDKLIKIADQLDRRNLSSEADQLDALAIRLAAESNTSAYEEQLRQMVIQNLRAAYEKLRETETKVGDTIATRRDEKIDIEYWHKVTGDLLPAIEAIFTTFRRIESGDNWHEKLWENASRVTSR
jgi:hypothetical protein